MSDETTIDLADYGLDEPRRKEAEAAGATMRDLGRVIGDHGVRLIVMTEGGASPAVAQGVTRSKGHDAERPAVGDWVVLRRAPGEGEIPLITSILERRSKLSRKNPGKEHVEQMVATNVDHALVLAALDLIPNTKRLQRFVALSRGGGVEPVIILSKADVTPNADELAQGVRDTLPRTAVHVISALEGTGLEALEPYLAKGSTIALLGASGVGKSTLLNRWSGTELQLTTEVREDGKGRHTTTTRSLFRLASGALVIDMPGVREVGLWGDDSEDDDTYDDIEALTAQCRFADCTHASEPDCAIRAAIKSGALPASRLAAYRALSNERAQNESRTKERTKLRDRAQAKALRKRLQDKGRKD